MRAEVLKKLSASKKSHIVVTYPQAIFEKIISQHTLKRIALKLKKDTEVSLGFVNERLFEMGFERVDFVSGQENLQSGEELSMFFLLHINIHIV